MYGRMLASSKKKVRLLKARLRVREREETFKNEGLIPDDQTEDDLDSQWEDLDEEDDEVEEEDSFEILTDPAVFSEVRDNLEKEGIKMASAEVTMIPQNYVSITSEEDQKNLDRILDLLDADDDVQDVYTNVE